jgi:hypothetical protein
MTSNAPAATHPGKIDYGKVAAALAALRALLIAGHVIIRDLWHDAGSGPGADYGRVVEITIENQPAELDAILTGMTGRSEPNHWYGNHFHFNEWRGHLMTMPVLVIERIRLERPEPVGPAGSAHGAPDLRTDDDQAPTVFPPLPAGGRAACADHPDFVPDTLHALKDHIEALHLDDPAAAVESPVDDPEAAPMDACSCWATSRNGCPVHYIRDDELPDPTLVRPYISQVDPRPLLELALDERFGPARGPVAPIEVITGPEVPADQLVDQFARAQGVVVVPGRDLSPERQRRVESAFSEYARARAMHYFGSHRFPTMVAARKAVAYWPGAVMLDPENFDIVAGALLDPPRTPEPAPAAEPERSRRLFALRTRKEA